MERLGEYFKCYYDDAFWILNPIIKIKGVLSTVTLTFLFSLIIECSQ